MVTGLLFGIFGLIVGSFLNVLVIRRGVRSVGGRSGCMACGAQLPWYDMIPVVSWIALGGKCRRCHAHISAQYPLVEGMTALLFGAIGGIPFFDLFYKALFCVIMALLIAIAAYDLRHTIIPDAWVYAFDALALLVMGPLMLLDPAVPLWFYLSAGPIAAAPLFFLWLVSGGRWMGLGDSKLALGIGWLLGPFLGIVAVFFAFVIGAVISVGVLLPLPHIARALRTYGITSLDMLRGGFTMTSEIPFGPFLIASCVLLWFLLLYNIPIPFFPLI